jgi:hypothetical protein
VREERKRQRTAALQDAVATDFTPLLPQGLGVRLSSAALLSVHWHAPFSRGASCKIELEPPYVGCYSVILTLAALLEVKIHAARLVRRSASLRLR